MADQTGPGTTAPWNQLAHGIHSVVWCTRKPRDVNAGANGENPDPLDDLQNWLAVKVVSDNRSIPPHDVIREVAILRDTSHVNIIPFLGFHSYGPDGPFALYMPLIPLSLSVLLCSPLFSPFPLTGPYSALIRPVLASSPQHDTGCTFTMVAKSLVYQLLLAVCYLHSLDPPIAHRDVNPSNILIDREGTVKLIDFGIAWSPRHAASSSEIIEKDESSERHRFDGWKETPEKMCYEVATGPHRAPELLFSPSSYSAPATDLWSLGTTIAEFFTPFRLLDSQSPLSSPSSTDSDETDLPVPFLMSPRLRSRIDYRAAWQRTTLFNGERGELGLVWSIFKLRGTPNEETWPSFNSLPDVSKIEFHKVNKRPLHAALPHLPPSPASAGSTNRSPEAFVTADGSPVSLIDSLLAYPPSSRLSAAQACHHAWFSIGLVLPVSHIGSSPIRSVDEDDSYVRPREWETQWKGKTLGKWLEPALRREASKLT